MKKIIMFFTILLAAVLSQAAWANTIWIPTESGQIDVQYFDADAPHMFAIFDDSSSLLDSDPHLILNNVPSVFSMAGDTISFTPNGSNWDLVSTKTGNTLTLTDSYRFQVAMQLPTAGVWIPNDSENKLSYGQYLLNWSNYDVSLLQIDAKPVPLPPALYLMGMGLVALAGVKRKGHRKG